MNLKLFFKFMSFILVGIYGIFFIFIFGSIFGVSLVLIGATCNALAMISNKFKMPVYNKTYNLRNDACHKNYKTKKNIKLFGLCDRFSFEISKYIFVFSIGDLLVLTGLASLFLEVVL